MVELEKVLNSLGRCSCLVPDACSDCDYNNFEARICVAHLTKDAREVIWDLLKAKEPKVMALEEVEDALDSVVWVDRPLLDNSSDEYALIDAYSRKTQIVELRYPFCDKDYRERADYANYGKTWRCWTARPTDEQREKVKWDAAD